MEIKITTLSENTATYGVLAEWGLSMLVEVDGLKILMDTGQGISTVHNAQMMGVNLAAIDKIVLSHGHYDHTGGLHDILKIKGEVEIIAHPDIWKPKYAVRNDEKKDFIGIPFIREALESKGAKFTLSAKPVRISDRIMTTGEIPVVTDYEIMEDNLLIRDGGEFKLEDMADDLALIIDTDYGLVVILGCAHRGIINTLRHAQNLTGKKSIYAAIGGTHLFRAAEERIFKTIADLREMGIQKLGVSHCTGFLASSMLAAEFRDSLFLNNAGSTFTLP